MPTTFSGESRTQSIARHIVDMIGEHQLSPGDALPSAKVLAAQFEVTVPTIREVLRGLEATGTVELRHGSGTYVGADVDRRFLVNPNGHTRFADARVQLIDARRVIEPPIAAFLATVPADERDLSRLEASLESSDSSLPDSPQQLNFHRELALATGNTVLFEVIDSFLSLRSREYRETRQMYDRDQDHAQHKSIFAAIAAGDAALTHTLMQEHLDAIRGAVLDQT